MKPLSVTISAFGSYAGEVKVDFTRIDHGIFLITGDTGAGKTTIFDAVCFALFGETSGRKREGGMMRSHYAQENRETFVTLRFSQKGRVYEVSRQPSYSRMSRRKNKDGEYTPVQVQAKARLILPDGTEFPGNVRDVNQKLLELIGVDFSQFSQIAMIAQGDYLRLLHAGSRERKEIFARIFDTGIYSRVQRRLKEEDSRLYGRLEDNRKLTEHELGLVEGADGQAREQWEELLGFRETRPAQIGEALDEMLLQEQRYIEELRRKRKDAEERNTFYMEQIRRAEEVNRLFRDWEQEKAALQALLEQEPEQKKKKEMLAAALRAERVRPAQSRLLERRRERERWEKAILSLEKEAACLEERRREAEKASAAQEELCRERLPLMQEQILRIQDTLPLYADWRRAEEACRRAAALEVQAQKEEEGLQEQVQSWSRRLEELDRRQEELAAQAEGADSWRQRMEALAERRRRLFALEKTAQAWEAAEDTLRGRQAAAVKAQKGYERAEGEYGRLYRDFLAAQAGIMARELSEGSPCPVCGATHHPSRASLHQGAATQAEVETARKKRDLAEEQRSAAAGEAVRAVDESRRLWERIQEEAGELLVDKAAEGPDLEKGSSGSKTGSDALDIPGLLSVDRSPADRSAALRGQLSQSLKDCGQALSQAQAALSRSVKAREELAGFREIRQAARQSMEEAQRAREQAGKRLQESRVRLAESRARETQLAGRLPETGEEEAKRLLAGKRREKEKLEEELARLREERDALIFQEKEKKGGLSAQQENGLGIKEALCRAQADYEAGLAGEGFSDEEEYTAALQPQELRERWERESREYEAGLLRSRTIDAQFARQAQGKERIDTTAWQEQAAALSREREELEREEGRLGGLHSRNGQARESLGRLWREREGLEEEYARIHRLCQTANGRINGLAGLDFQTYVQRQYFKRMIQAANRRLRVMTDSQFLLQCRELDALGRQGEVGLDLDVYSLAADRVRDVKTLSGGESFLAALAMALGMADVIQETAGNIEMDAMFIDEGFGSLDEESRLRAIRILQELAQGRRLIGIISHVPELKEQIDRKLLVSRDEQGSRIEWRLEGQD